MSAHLFQAQPDPKTGLKGMFFHPERLRWEPISVGAKKLNPGRPLHIRTLGSKDAFIPYPESTAAIVELKDPSPLYYAPQAGYDAMTKAFTRLSIGTFTPQEGKQVDHTDELIYQTNCGYRQVEFERGTASLDSKVYDLPPMRDMQNQLYQEIRDQGYSHYELQAGQEIDLVYDRFPNRTQTLGWTRGVILKRHFVSYENMVPVRLVVEVGTAQQPRQVEVDQRFVRAPGTHSFSYRNPKIYQHVIYQDQDRMIVDVLQKPHLKVVRLAQTETQPLEWVPLSDVSPPGSLARERLSPRPELFWPLRSPTGSMIEEEVADPEEWMNWYTVETLEEPALEETVADLGEWMNWYTPAPIHQTGPYYLTSEWELIKQRLLHHFAEMHPSCSAEEYYQLEQQLEDPELLQPLIELIQVIRDPDMSEEVYIQQEMLPSLLTKGRDFVTNFLTLMYLLLGMEEEDTRSFSQEESEDQVEAQVEAQVENSSLGEFPTPTLEQLRASPPPEEHLQEVNNQFYLTLPITQPSYSKPIEVPSKRNWILNCPTPFQTIQVTLGATYQPSGKTQIRVSSLEELEEHLNRMDLFSVEAEDLSFALAPESQVTFIQVSDFLSRFLKKFEWSNEGPTQMPTEKMEKEVEQYYPFSHTLEELKASPPGEDLVNQYNLQFSMASQFNS